ncbi:hypothetical protein BGW38_006810 [Lunasporangiospora selenospora]|uniref:beta-mannosidase n=1 Tax=Lunasporangiospora selenospora TaxID=979761 RepID=A0A9P6KIN5_9FUNG|nr:hypothetical protein BGW38_006810 [Lunasporangiospora selenospora]
MALIESGLDKDFYYGTNYVKDSMRRIIEDEWIYTRTFRLTEDSYAFALLDCEGLDTIASVVVNGQEIGRTENQFRHFQWNISKVLKPKENVVSISFKSATLVAKKEAENYPYYVPDMFNMSAAQHGYPCRNFIRKEQCSFSWDWGPAFAPCGIWRPISVKFDYDGILVSDWFLETSLSETATHWQINIHLIIHSDRPRECSVQTRFSGDLPEHSELLQVAAGKDTYKIVIDIERTLVKMWWPRGYGDPTTYDVRAGLLDETSTVVAIHDFVCGFRTCNLVQDPILDRNQDSKGDSFHFSVNEMDLFAKGTNWIPGHVFDQLVTLEKKRVLLESCVAANMNMIRIWGGGRYETDEFYQLCSELGIMVWQEFMFACALCPSNDGFLDNVRKEVVDQVQRLMVHPCIVLWSGNNENQEFMVKGSPSAGVISRQPYTERYILQDSERGLYGDVHFYDYKHNGMHVENYPNARFVSGKASTTLIQRRGMHGRLTLTLLMGLSETN